MKKDIYLGQHIVYQHAVDSLLSNSTEPTISLHGLSECEDFTFFNHMAQSLQAQRNGMAEWLKDSDNVNPSFTIIPSLLIDESGLSSFIEEAAQSIGLPLQVRDNDFNSYHRHYPIRRPKNIAPTADYFETEVLNEQGRVCIERMNNHCFDYAILVEAGYTSLYCTKVFGLNKDHGVLQEIFEDKLLLKNSLLALQIQSMIDGCLKAFGLSGCQFTIYCTADKSSVYFSHINLSMDLPWLVYAWQKLSADSNGECGYMTARLVYHAVNHERLFTENNIEYKYLGMDKPPAYYLPFTENKQAKLDRPIGVTIAQASDVRQSLRQAIRYENLLTGRLALY